MKKQGISLIILVITVIVMAILAGAVITYLSNTNIMEEASEAKFKNDMSEYKSKVNVWVANEIAEDGASFDITTKDVSKSSNATLFEEVFGDNVSSDYENKLKVIDGVMYFVTSDVKEQSLLMELGIPYAE